MYYRKLGDSGLEVSEVGFGTWGIGGNSYGEVDDEVSRKALKLAIKSGINFFDTADLYGNGHSEILLSEFTQSTRTDLIIATKGGTLPHDTFFMPQDFSPSYLTKALEASLKRLKTDYIDLYLLHSPPFEVLSGNDELYKTLEKFKSDGKIRSFGLSSRSPQDAFVAMKEFRYEIIEINFNIIDQRALDISLFDEAERLNIGVIARTPLAFGFLSGKLTGDEVFSEGDHRKNWPRDQLKMWANANKYFSFLFTGQAITPAQAALRYCLQFRTIGSVIPGMLNENEVIENSEATNLPMFTSSEMKRIRTIYLENKAQFYNINFKKVNNE